MKRLMSLLLAVALIGCLAVSPVLAQHRGGHGGGDHTARMLAELKEKLSLTPEQVTKVQSILQNFHQQNQGQRPSPEAWQQLHQQIMNVLTPEQQAKYKEWLQQHEQHGAPGGSASPPSH